MPSTPRRKSAAERPSGTPQLPTVLLISVLVVLIGQLIVVLAVRLIRPRHHNPYLLKILPAIRQPSEERQVFPMPSWYADRG